MIAVHFFDYFVIIVSDVVTTLNPANDLRAYVIIESCNLAVISVDNLIFGLIISQLATKVLAITANSTQTLARSLMDAPAPTD